MGWLPRTVMWLAILAVSSWGIWLTYSQPAEFGASVLGVAVLLLTGLTIDVTLLRGAVISISTPDELGYEDIVFWGNPAELAFDFLIQVHAAVANVGAKPAVITRLRLTRIVNGKGKSISLPNTPAQIGGNEYRTWEHWMESQRIFERTDTPPPFVLPHDTVMIARFRCGRGIQWGERWNLAETQNLREQLASGVREVDIEVGYREGSRLRTKNHRLRIKVAGLDSAQACLDAAIAQLATTPYLPERQARVD